MNVKAATRGVTENPDPEPERLTVWGLPGALSLIANVEIRDPVAEAVKVTLMVQEVVGARLVPQLLVCAKSPELPLDIAIELMFSCTLPVFVRVTGTALLVVPVGTLPKLMLVGLRLTTGTEPPPTGAPMSDWTWAWFRAVL